MRDRSGSQRGFTMIEVLIAILLTVIAVIGIVALFMSQVRASSFSRHATEAAALAADKLEKLRTMTPPTSGTAATLDVQGQDGGIYDLEWTVNVGGSYTELTVRVGWDEEDTAAASCTTHADCTSEFCNGSSCYSHAVVVHGRRN